MKRKELFILAIVFVSFFFNRVGGTTLPGRPFQEKIRLSQEKEIIALVYYFCVLDDETILLNDIKDRKLMLYDNRGQLLKSWSWEGQGPGEYQGIWSSDYFHPFLGLHDPRVQKVILYRRTGKTDFRWVEDIYAASQNVTGFKLFQDKIIDSLNHLGPPYKVIGLVPREELKSVNRLRNLLGVQFELFPLEEFSRFRPNYYPALFGMKKKRYTFYFTWTSWGKDLFLHFFKNIFGSG